MLRKLGEHTVWMTVISAGRPQQVKPMTDLIGPASWYVPDTDRQAYKDASLQAQDSIRFEKGSDKAVVPVRNDALLDAWRNDVPCIQLDDDLMRVMKVNEPMRRSEWWADSPHVLAVIGDAVQRLASSPYKLAGGAPTNNAYFTRKRTTDKGFIKSGFWVVEPCGLMLDELLKTKFDYDYTLQHVFRFGGVTRCDDLIFDFNQFTMAGGHSVDRTKDDKSREYNAIRYLEGKWGTEIIRRNPRRPGEILLKFPKRIALT